MATHFTRASKPHLWSEFGGFAIDRTAVPDCSFAAIFPRRFDEGADSVGAFGSSDAEDVVIGKVAEFQERRSSRWSSQIATAPSGLRRAL